METCPPRWERLFRCLRRVVLFLLGVIVILDGLAQSNARLLVVGLILAGVLPLDDVLRMFARRPNRDDEDEGEADVT